MKKIKAEYIWMDGHKPTEKLRSKTKILNEKIKNIDDLPIWGFDGSSTMQATGHLSDCMLKPVKYIPDPIRGGDNVIVLCEVFNADVSVFLRGARFSLFYCNECDEAPPLTLTNLLHHIFAIHSSPQNVLESIGIKESLCLAKTRPFFP